MARRYKTTTSAPVDLALGWLAAAVWFVTQGVSWLRLLVVGMAVAAALALAPTGTSPVRGAGSTWDPHFMVLAPGAAVAVVGSE